MIKILQPKILGIIIASFAFGIIASTSNMSALADEGVPEWFKGVAGFWAEGKISTTEFLDGIEFLLAQEIINVEGYGLLSEAQAEGVDQESLDEIWSAINDLQNEVDGISVGTPSTYVKYHTGTTSDNSIVLDCDEGDVVTGGGFGTLGGTVLATYPNPSHSNPSTTLVDPTGWRAVLDDTIAADIWVVCLDLTPDEKPMITIPSIKTITPAP